MLGSHERDCAAVCVASSVTAVHLLATISVRGVLTHPASQELQVGCIRVQRVGREGSERFLSCAIEEMYQMDACLVLIHVDCWLACTP